MHLVAYLLAYDWDDGFISLAGMMFVGIGIMLLRRERQARLANEAERESALRASLVQE
jgi:hypothetical protein